MRYLRLLTAAVSISATACAAVGVDPASLPVCAALVAESDGSSYRPRLREPAQARRVVDRVYPPHARQSGIEGRALVKVLVDVEGRVTQVELARSTGHAVLDRAAMEGSREFVFRPAVNDGCRVEAWVRMPVTFSSR